jgi:hypothetical protein
VGRLSSASRVRKKGNGIMGVLLLSISWAAVCVLAIFYQIRRPKDAKDTEITHKEPILTENDARAAIIRRTREYQMARALTHASSRDKRNAAPDPEFPAKHYWVSRQAPLQAISRRLANESTILKATFTEKDFTFTDESVKSFAKVYTNIQSNNAGEHHHHKEERETNVRYASRDPKLSAAHLYKTVH